VNEPDLAPYEAFLAKLEACAGNGWGRREGSIRRGSYCPMEAVHGVFGDGGRWVSSTDDAFSASCELTIAQQSAVARAADHPTPWDGASRALHTALRARLLAACGLS
jgi:hypothetical protein